MHKFYAKVGLKVHSHDFRTTCVTEILNDTMNVVAASNYLDHQNIATT